MTDAGRKAEVLAGADRCGRILDGSPAAGLRFAGWFVPAWHGSCADPLLMEAFRGWARVLDDADAFDWWRARLPVECLSRGLFGVGRIETFSGGWWAPAEGRGGQPAVLAPVLAGDPAEALEVFALDPAAPGRWWRRTGLAGVLPGDWALRPDETADGTAARLRIYETAWDWLAGGAAAGSACVLDWRADAARDLLADLDDGRVVAVCDDEGHARRLRARARPRRPDLALEVAVTPPAAAAASPELAGAAE